MEENVDSTHRPLYSRERTPVRIELEAGWAPRDGLDVAEKRKINYPYLDSNI
jgi:hypothetical protein